ncbi:MAG: DeoR family transcriptional regulator [Bryobacteraceae bacterium]
MRKSRLLGALLSTTRQGILATALLNPGKSWYVNELARHLGVRPSTIQRDLVALSEAGILERREDGNRVYYQADRNCPIFRELRQIFLKTAGVADVLKEALAPLEPRLDLAFVYGSIASSEERSGSDIDLMLVGQAPLSEAAAALRGAERRLGRSINPTVYTTEEFLQRIREKHHFLTSVLREELLFLKGTQAELARLAQGAADPAARHQRAGDRRPARGR